MPKVSFDSPGGARREFDAPPGASAMRVAVTNGVDEIVAECGGSLACATCHVYVEPSQWSLLSPPGAAEDDMLAMVAAERRPTSRLCCQIILSETTNGLVLHLPDRQL